MEDMDAYTQLDKLMHERHLKKFTTTSIIPEPLLRARICFAILHHIGRMHSMKIYNNNLTPSNILVRVAKDDIYVRFVDWSYSTRRGSQIDAPLAAPVAPRLCSKEVRTMIMEHLSIKGKPTMVESSHKWDIAAAASLICLMTNDSRAVDKLWRYYRKNQSLSPLQSPEMIQEFTKDFTGKKAYGLAIACLRSNNNDDNGIADLIADTYDREFM